MKDRHHHDTTNYEKEGWNLKDQKKYKDAIHSFDKAIKNNQKLYFAYHGKGECLLEIQEYDKALDCFIAAIRIDAKHPWAYHGAGRVYFYKESYQSALAFFDKSINLGRNGVLARYWKGRTLLKIGDYKNAEDSLKIALANAISTKNLLTMMPEIEQYLNDAHENVKEIPDESPEVQHIINNYTIGDNSTLNRVSFGTMVNKCPKCGAELHDEDIFCSNCGERIKQ